jgi:hypothetical protein
VDGTIDIRQYAVVREREKWLDILLGEPPPNFPEVLEELTAPRLPEKLVHDLTVRLKPPHAQ